MENLKTRKVEVIAEIGQAHDASVGILYSYIDALAKTGVDTIKFQTHIASAESSEFEQFRVKFSHVDQTRYDYWKRMELSLEQWQKIKSYTETKGVKFLSSPFSIAAVDLLQKIGVERFKVGSGELLNSLLLQKLAYTQKPVILSTGLADREDLQRALKIFEPTGNDITILQCTTAYPTKPEDWGLPHLKAMLSDYPQYNIGFSDHSSSIYSGASAVALGAKVLEFHAVFDKRMFGPDSAASLEINEISSLVDGIRKIETSLNNTLLKSELIDPRLQKLFGKTLCARKELSEGQTLDFDDLEAKKPAGYGISAQDFEEFIGKKLSRRIKAGEFLEKKDFD